MSDLSIPRLADLIAPVAVRTPPHHNATGDAIPVGVIAAVRYDYEVALMSMADVSRKYQGLMSAATSWRIMSGKIHPEIKAAHHRLEWCKRIWGKK